MSKRILIIVAHADDMEFMAAGTIARMTDVGYEAHEIIATNNERGTLDSDWSPRFTADTRREEARRGAKVLGVNPDVEFLGYEDGRLSETPLNELRERCIRAIRAHKPDILFTWDPFTHTITELTECDQVYVCLWSHAGWTPGHIHFVLQPAWNNQQTAHERPGPFMQEEMFRAGNTPAAPEVEAFCERARGLLSSTRGER